MQNPVVFLFVMLCGVPGLVTLAVIFFVRALAKSHIVIDVERSDRPTPDVLPEHKRITFRFELQERKPRKVAPVEDEE